MGGHSKALAGDKNLQHGQSNRVMNQRTFCLICDLLGLKPLPKNDNPVNLNTPPLIDKPDARRKPESDRPAGRLKTKSGKLRKEKAPKQQCFGAFNMVRLAGIEPTTPWFVAKYSIQLSYSRKAENSSTAGAQLTIAHLVGSTCYALRPKQ